MGTWGDEPRDGDAPFDLVSVMGDLVSQRLVETFSEKPPRDTRTKGFKIVGLDDTRSRRASQAAYLWSRIGLVQILSEDWRIPIPLDVAHQCLANIETCVKDLEFVGSWRTPRKFARTARTLWGWLASVIQATEESIKELGTSRRLKRGARRPLPRLVYESIFGYGTKAGRKGRRWARLELLGCKTPPPELEAAFKAAARVPGWAPRRPRLARRRPSVAAKAKSRKPR